MKWVFVLLLFLCSMINSCDFIDVNKIRKNSHVRDEDYEKIADRVTGEVARKLKLEKGLQSAGVGGRMMNDIQRMAMSFQFFHEVDLDEARKILVYSIVEYLNAINSSKDLRPYLHNYPFKSENVEIMIWVKKANGQDVSSAQIGFMSAMDDVLSYGLPRESGVFARKILHEETYEEALKIIKEQEEASRPQAS